MDTIVTPEARLRSYWTVLLAGIWLAALFILFRECGGNPNFWFDESGQFWMSRGQIHFSRPLTPEGNLAAVLWANRTANMDPGGYTVALHWWMLLGTSPGWLRSFSFIFFVVTMLSFAGLCYLWTRNLLLSLIVGLVPACAPLLTEFALELRPYSMEACAIAVSLLLLEYASRRPTLGRYLGLGCVVGLFLTSRYSVICTAAAVGLGVLWSVRKLERKQALLFVAAYCLPVIVSCAAIYLITLGNPGSHQKADPAPYVQSFIMYGKAWGEKLAIAGKGLFSPHGIGGPVLVGSYLFFAARRSKGARYQLFTTLVIVVAALYAEFFVLSLIGKYPWCPQARWGITLNTVSALSWFPVLWMVLGALRTLDKNLAQICLVLGMACSLAALYNTGTTKLSTRETIYANLMALGPETLRGRYLFVDMNAQASLRYLYEFGPLKKYAEGIYPQCFRFEIPANFQEGNRPFDYLVFTDHIQRGENFR